MKKFLASVLFCGFLGSSVAGSELTFANKESTETVYSENENEENSKNNKDFTWWLADLKWTGHFLIFCGAVTSMVYAWDKREKLGDKRWEIKDCVPASCQNTLWPCEDNRRRIWSPEDGKYCDFLHSKKRDEEWNDSAMTTVGYSVLAHVTWGLVCYGLRKLTGANVPTLGQMYDQNRDRRDVYYTLF